MNCTNVMVCRKEEERDREGRAIRDLEQPQKLTQKNSNNIYKYEWNNNYFYFAEKIKIARYRFFNFNK